MLTSISSSLNAIIFIRTIYCVGQMKTYVFEVGFESIEAKM